MNEYLVLWGYGKAYVEAEQNLSKQVEDCLKKGWKLQGGVSVLVDGFDHVVLMFQAMVK